MVKIIDKLLEDNFTSTEIAKQLAQVAKRELLTNSANLQLISELLKVEGSSMPDLELIVALGSTLQLSDKKQLTEAVVAKAPLQKQNATTSKQGNHEIEPKIAAITNSKPTQLESVINIMGGGEEIAINE